MVLNSKLNAWEIGRKIRVYSKILQLVKLAKCVTPGDTIKAPAKVFWTMEILEIDRGEELNT